MTNEAGAVETSASRLARLRELLEACTEGPWAVERDSDLLDVDYGPEVSWPWRIKGVCNFSEEHYAGQNGSEMEANATFIAEARNALPGLLEVCEAARALRDSPHHVVLNEEGWELEHTLECRMTGMTKCELHLAMQEWAKRISGPPKKLGRFVVELNAEQMPVLTSVDAPDPAFALAAALENLEGGAE